MPVLLCSSPLPSYFIEYFATDLLMTPDGECVGVIAVCMEVREGINATRCRVRRQEGRKEGERELADLASRKKEGPLAA